MFQMPQYKNQYGDNWGSLSQFGSTSGYLNSPDASVAGGGITSQGGPDLLNQVSGVGEADPSMLSQFGNWFKNSGFSNTTDMKTGIKTDGWGGQALGLAQGLGSAYLGYSTLEANKKMAAFQMDAFNKNYAAQRQATNTGMQDRQAARVAANSGAYQSVGDYMNQNRIR